MTSFDAGTNLRSSWRKLTAQIATLAAASVMGPASAIAEPSAYFVNMSSSTVSVFDGDAVETIQVGNAPVGIAISPDGKRVYVANSNASSLSVIDTSTYNVIGGVSLPGMSPKAIAVSPDGRKAYVATVNPRTPIEAGSLSVVDTISRTVLSTASVGKAPEAVAISARGFVYVVNRMSKNVSIFFTSNMEPFTRAVGASPSGIAVTLDGMRVYISNAGDNNVTVLDEYNNFLTNITVGGEPTALALTPDGKEVYVLNSGSKTVSAIDVATNTVTATANIGPGSTKPSALGALGAGEAYVTDYTNGDVTFINVHQNSQGAHVKIGDNPVAMAIVPPRESVVYGVINANGSVLSPKAHSFQVFHNGVGTYDIEFGYPPFVEPPAIVGSQTNLQNLGESSMDNVVFPYVHTGNVTAITGDDQSHHSDRSFSFIARGRR